MTNEEAKRYWTARYEAARNWDDPHWEASERKDHRRYVDALKAAIEALSEPIVCKDYRIDDDHIYCSPKVADRVVEALSERTGERICEVNRMDDLISRQDAIDALMKAHGALSGIRHLQKR